MIIISTHAVFLDKKDIYGPPHAISKFLDKRLKTFIFIKHPLTGNSPSIIEYHGNGKLNKSVRVDRKTGSLIVYIKEFIINFRTVVKSGNKETIYIGVDPLNAFAGVILKFLGKVKRVVYFSADFSPKRFDNFLLNSVYLSLDFVSMHFSDQTWSVSRRIQNYRKSKGLSGRKNLRMPNAPFFSEVPRKSISRIRIEDLVLVSNFTKDIDFFLLIDTVDLLIKNNPKIRLLLIGAGILEEELRQYVKSKNLGKNILFLGTKTHDEMFEVLVKSGVGIALYANSDKNHFRYFSDPMKVRDYMASGLPVIISGNSAINSEIEKNNSGFVVTLDKVNILRSIKKIIKGNKAYEAYRNNAIKHAKMYDTEMLINKYLNGLYG